MRRGSRVGKYRILGPLGTGGFGRVYRARDTVEDRLVALKIPSPHLRDEFLKEVRLAVRLEHPNILPLQNAAFVNGSLVVAYPMGVETLADRLRRRISTKLALHLFEQLLEGLAYAHAHRVIHCDVKPENLILFPGDRLRLTDFGIARKALRTVTASGSGTVGFVAPEQALGKPSFRSDVFSAGLVLYRTLAGVLPEWPYRWPPPGVDRLKKKLPPRGLEFLQRALSVDHRKRFADAGVMLRAFQRVLKEVRRQSKEVRRSAAARPKRTRARSPDWRRVRHREFRRRFRKALVLRDTCSKCDGPLSAEMRFCPWCKHRLGKVTKVTRFPDQCSRCGRGRKADWKYCAWCYGAGFKKVSSRSYDDARYTSRCHCGGALMPWMRYCPWCRSKVQRRWRLPGVREACPSCKWGVVPSFWDFCGWCGKGLRSPTGR